MDLSNEVRRRIAQKLSWTRLNVQGSDDGKYYKLSGQVVPECLQSGMDEYSKAFRAGYYSRDY
jgi:hypothetical protein